MSSVWTDGSRSRASSSDPILTPNKASTNPAWPGRRHRKVAPIPGVYPGYDIFQIQPGRCLRIRYANRMPRDNACEKKIKKHLLAICERVQNKDPGSGLVEQLLKKEANRTENNASPRYGINENIMQLPNAPAPPVILKQHRKERWADTVGTDINLSQSGKWSPKKTSKSHGIRASTASSIKVRVTQGAQSARQQTTTPETNEELSVRKSQQNSSLDHVDDSQTYSSQIQESSVQESTNSVIFLIHGVGGSADVWQSQMTYFGARGYELVVPDLIGHGFSSAPREVGAYDFEAITKDLLFVFDTFCKTNNVVIGHSYGASFAAVLGHQRPGLVTHLVLISGGSPTPLAPQPGIFSLPTCMLACLKPVVSRGFRKSAFHAKKESLSQEEAFSVPTYVLRNIMNGQKWPEGNSEYHEHLVQPTLLIHGRQDRLVSIDEEEQMFKAISTCQLVVLENSSHMVMMEKPDEVNELIHSFLLKGQGTTGIDPGSGDGHLDDSQPSCHYHMPREVTTSRASLRSVKSIPSNLLVNSIG